MAIEFGMWRCERSGRSFWVDNQRERQVACRVFFFFFFFKKKKKKKKRDTECRMMVKATPTAAFIVTETKFLSSSR